MSTVNDANGSKKHAAQVRVNLVPRAENQTPVLINYTACQPAQGFVLIDGGFLEPQVLAAVAQAAKSGQAPESINAALGVRVALTPDAAANLYQQLGRLLRAKTSPRSTKPQDGAPGADKL